VTTGILSASALLTFADLLSKSFSVAIKMDRSSVTLVAIVAPRDVTRSASAATVVPGNLPDVAMVRPSSGAALAAFWAALRAIDAD
jgi:hypothetical protein